MNPKCKGIALRAKAARPDSGGGAVPGDRLFQHGDRHLSGDSEPNLKLRPDAGMRMTAYTKLSKYAETLEACPGVTETFERLARKIVCIASGTGQCCGRSIFGWISFQEELSILERAEDILKRVGDRPSSSASLYANSSVALTKPESAAQRFTIMTFENHGCELEHAGGGSVWVPTTFC